MNSYYETKKQIISSSDVLELIAAAKSMGNTNILIHSEHLIEDFFNLKSCLAGEFLQKFINYHIRVAIILNKNIQENIRFKEMALESNKQGEINYFVDKESGIKWLGLGK